MKRYFINPELKISSGILLCLMSLFFLFTVLTLNFHNDNLKEAYVDRMGAVAARVIEKAPELESEIIPLITKDLSQGDAEKGREVLGQYGLSRKLEDELFPNMNETIRKNYYSMTYIFIFFTAAIFIFNYFQCGYFYDRMRKLTLGAKRVIEGEYDISISENREGDLSKLATSFNSMRDVIRNNISELKKEKQFLVDLLSDISHQMKTPLSSMIVYNDILLNKDLTNEQRRTFLLNNENQLNRMQWLIQSILKLAKLDAKAIALDKDDQSLNETLQEAVDSLESKAYECKVKITLKEEGSISFYHDRLWLQEAFINIIKNGIEHTPVGGEVRIHLYENPIYKRVVIEDTGEGIREEDLPHIFKRFYKAKTSRKSDSIGIGLALAKSIVEAHGGMIEVQSKVNRGTRFIVTFLGTEGTEGR